MKFVTRPAQSTAAGTNARAYVIFSARWKTGSSRFPPSRAVLSSSSQEKFFFLPKCVISLFLTSSAISDPGYPFRLSAISWKIRNAPRETLVAFSKREESIWHSGCSAIFSRTVELRYIPLIYSEKNSRFSRCVSSSRNDDSGFLSNVPLVEEMKTSTFRLVFTRSSYLRNPHRILAKSENRDSPAVSLSATREKARELPQTPLRFPTEARCNSRQSSAQTRTAESLRFSHEGKARVHAVTAGSALPRLSSSSSPSRALVLSLSLLRHHLSRLRAQAGVRFVL